MNKNLRNDDRDGIIVDFLGGEEKFKRILTIAQEKRRSKALQTVEVGISDTEIEIGKINYVSLYKPINFLKDIYLERFRSNLEESILNGNKFYTEDPYLKAYDELNKKSSPILHIPIVPKKIQRLGFNLRKVFTKSNVFLILVIDPVCFKEDIYNNTIVAIAANPIVLSTDNIDLYCFRLEYDLFIADEYTFDLFDIESIKLKYNGIYEVKRKEFKTDFYADKFYILDPFLE